MAMIPFLAGMVLISAWAVADLGLLKDSLSRFLNVYGKRNQLGNEAIRAVGDLQAAQVSFIHAKSKESQEKFLKLEDLYLSTANRAVSAYLDIAGEFAKKNLPKAQETLKTWSAVDQQIRRLVNEQRSDAALDLSLTQGAEFQEEFRKILDACYESSGEKMKAEAENGFDTYNRAKFQTWLIDFIASCFGIGFTFILVTRMSRAVDEIISDLKGNSDALSGASAELADSAKRTAESASDQSSSLVETAASVEQLSQIVKKNATNAVSSIDVSNKSQEAATEGQRVVEEMVQAISEINRSNEEIVAQVDENNREISEIVKVINEISTKTKVINDIVFQTKLLSFNASVEAARAGEHGKGFAVVAEEVGNLAQMSGNAANEISSMLSKSIEQVQGIVNKTKVRVEGLVETSKKKAEFGASVAKRCGDGLNEIVQNVVQVNARINEISQASQQQSSGIDNINKVMTHLDEVTQHNATEADKGARAAGTLADQAHSLADSVSKLAVVIQGGRTKHNLRRSFTNNLTDGGAQVVPFPGYRPDETLKSTRVNTVKTA